jgi:hypothetical protein
MPKRIQRKCGEKLPAGAVYVGRPTPFGNPFVNLSREASVASYRHWLAGDYGLVQAIGVDEGCSAGWVARRLEYLEQKRQDILRRLPELRGKDLACWCKLSDACYADCLLEMANEGETA